MKRDQPQLFGIIQKPLPLKLLKRIDQHAPPHRLPIFQILRRIRTRRPVHHKPAPGPIPVSYTHLDVYKRQLYGMDYWLDLAKLGIFMILSLILGLLLRKPVIRLNEAFSEKLEETKLM